MSARSFEKFLLAELWRAYELARKGKRKTIDEHRFEVNDMEILFSFPPVLLGVAISQVAASLLSYMIQSSAKSWLRPFAIA